MVTHCYYTHHQGYKLEDIIDITVPLTTEMPIWPGSKGIRITPTRSMDKGDSDNVSRLDCNLHTGTHVDAPRHFLQNGTTIEQLPLDVFVGPSYVVHLPDAADITAGDLDDLNLPSGIERLLLRTRNSELWTAEITEFRKDFVALTYDAAQWIVDKGIRLIGVDYLSVQRFSDDARTHQILLGADIIALEGLNLSDVKSGFYELICLPLRLAGAEASPVRAILRQLPQINDEPSTKGGRL
jgi:arylformamidase